MYWVAIGRLWRVAAMSEGHAAVDAMVAMLILAMTIVLSMRAVEQSHRAAAMAQEVAAATTLLAELMQEGPRTFQPATGSRDGFTWVVQTGLTGGDRPVEVCHRAVTLHSQRTSKTYAASSLETCPPADNS